MRYPSTFDLACGGDSDNEKPSLRAFVTEKRRFLSEGRTYDGPPKSKS